MSEYIVDLAEGYAGTVLDTKEEIVRCEDCKRSYEVINGLNELQLRCKHWLDDDTPYIVTPNGFCAWGERRDDD